MSINKDLALHAEMKMALVTSGEVGNDKQSSVRSEPAAKSGSVLDRALDAIASRAEQKQAGAGRPIDLERALGGGPAPDVPASTPPAHDAGMEM